MPKHLSKKKPIILAINFCPLCGGRVQQSALLDIGAPLARWTVHCVDGAWCHMTGTDDVERIIFMTKAAAPTPGDIDAAIDHAATHRVLSVDRMETK